MNRQSAGSCSCFKFTRSRYRDSPVAGCVCRVQLSVLTDVRPLRLERKSFHFAVEHSDAGGDSRARCAFTAVSKYRVNWRYRRRGGISTWQQRRASLRWRPKETATMIDHTQDGRRVVIAITVLGGIWDARPEMEQFGTELAAAATTADIDNLYSPWTVAKNRKYIQYTVKTKNNLRKLNYSTT